MTQQTHHGSCHCGRLRFEVQADITYAVNCNCSLCRRKGALWHPAAEEDLKITSGEADLELYQFGTKTAKHYFCKQCGISTLTRPRLDPTRWAVNIRCIDGIDLPAVKVVPFDGEHWEDAAKALRAKVGKRPAS
jgi:hypothetical protein